ncbi:ead/Ea22-like family protein [Enterobacter hormaechei]|uniref:ead/Ea22-like family protein n=1 Tax=Enterobacter hormaechei TaxID=158836 RepID=UPI0006978672|nr:ead/Ea22-like family protein [Enterobacter hormaechei]EKV9562685.1 ead/Ea22-like family protein [Enterobacter hormaechei]EKW7488671.1 ead/Ea22-like family protein [Enterobacter hormaechei]
MSNIDKLALREAAEKHGDDDILALLDELEAKDKQIDDLKATAAHSNAGWTEAHGQEARAEAAEKRIAELEAKKVKIKLPESFYPDGDIDCPLVINEYQIIEAIVAAGCKPIAVCPRCKCELDLSHKPDGAHYCHPAAADKGE